MLAIAMDYWLKAGQKGELHLLQHQRCIEVDLLRHAEVLKTFILMNLIITMEILLIYQIGDIKPMTARDKPGVEMPKEK